MERRGKEIRVGLERGSGFVERCDPAQHDSEFVGAHARDEVMRRSRHETGCHFDVRVVVVVPTSTLSGTVKVFVTVGAGDAFRRFILVYNISFATRCTKNAAREAKNFDTIVVPS
jgi:hypothetical protein